MPLGHDTKLGMAMRFQVVVDGIDLGGWASCKGLSVDFKPFAVKEGGIYDHVHYLPDRLEYPAVTLTRAMDSGNSAKVQKWLSSKVDDYSPATAQITLFDATAHKVATWSLRNVFPSKWTGPDLDANSHNTATETLVLVHEGFL